MMILISGQDGDDGVVQERVPAVRQLHQREVARELDAAVHRHQVVRLEDE